MRTFFPPKNLLHCQWIFQKTKDKRSRQNKLLTRRQFSYAFFYAGVDEQQDNRCHPTLSSMICLLLLGSAVGGNLAVRVDNNGTAVLWTSSLVVLFVVDGELFCWVVIRELLNFLELFGKALVLLTI